MPTSRSGYGSAAATETPTLKVAVVARRLGVAPATLRTWARRYGLGPSAHLAGAHRQYSGGDLARLAVMRRLTLEGVAPAEAARIALATPVGPASQDGVASVTTLPVDPEQREPVRHQPAEAGAVRGAEAVPSGRAGRGRVVAMPAAGSAARGLARAALSLDSAACRRILEAAIGRHGVVASWENLARPVLVAIGQRWETTGTCVDVEHLFSEAVLSSLRSASSPGCRRSVASVLLACSENEQHALPVHVLGAALDERGVTVRVLGARMPRRALADAVRRSGPAAVLVSATMPVEEPDALSELPRLRPAPRLFVGGPGWAGVALPAGTSRLRSLAESVEKVSAVVSG